MYIFIRISFARPAALPQEALPLCVESASIIAHATCVRASHVTPRVKRQHPLGASTPSVQLLDWIAVSPKKVPPSVPCDQIFLAPSYRRQFRALGQTFRPKSEQPRIRPMMHGLMMVKYHRSSKSAPPRLRQHINCASCWRSCLDAAQALH